MTGSAIGGPTKGDFANTPMPRCIELLHKERTYDLPSRLRGERVVVNAAVVGNEFDGGELPKLAQASEGRPIPKA